MAGNREALDAVASSDLVGSSIVVRCTPAEIRHYTLFEIKGRGKTGVAWAATDRFNRRWVIKFVLKQDYGTHSLEAEAFRVAQLTSRRIPQIDFYGTPEFDAGKIEGGLFYAIAVPFIEGTS